jgi:predicted SAM-dependent methyltransferase
MIINFFVKRLLNKHQQDALNGLLTEFVIAKHHRNGINKIKRLGLKRPNKINLGSAHVTKPGFLNIDLFPAEGLDLTLDLRNPLPFDSNSCEMIFSEHFFEHINYPEPVLSLFKECYRVLKPGGILRFSVPDTEWPLTDYSKGPEADYFKACIEHKWHPEKCETMVEHINYHFRQDGEHLFAYDYETAKKVLVRAGFNNVKREQFDLSLDSVDNKYGSLIIWAEKA